jgi:hypothetical protein
MVVGDSSECDGVGLGVNALAAVASAGVAVPGFAGFVCINGEVGFMVRVKDADVCVEICGGDGDFKVSTPGGSANIIRICLDDVGCEGRGV